MQFLLKEDGFKLLQETGDRLILARTIVTPKVGLQGADILTLYIESEDGAFDGTSVASFSGTGIIVNSTTLVDATHVKVSVSIDPGATLSTRDVTITTGIVVVFAPGLFTIKAQGATTSATAAFQYTLLTRGNDIRRNPGISIKDVLNNTPNVCAFTVDGSSNTPVIGEKIEIRDTFNGNRLLFAGTVQSIEQVYEGLIDQLAWHVQAIDFTWLLNRKRPFGSYQNVSASVIVKELIANYAPGFTTLHVQTSLAKVTAIFDGSDDLVTVLTKIAAAIGGGHWYVDYDMDVHFFHIKPAIELPPSEFESPSNHITLSLGGAVSAPYSAGFYFLRHTFLYSDGSESKFGSISNIVHSHGTERLVVDTIPLGSTRGSLTCVGRRIYYNQFLATQANDKIETIRGFCQINDNVTTKFTTNFGAQGADSSVVVATGSVKTYNTSLVATPAGMVLLSNPAAILNLIGSVSNGAYGVPPSPTYVTPPGAGTIIGPGVSCRGFNPGQNLIFRWSAGNGNGMTDLGAASVSYVMTGSAGYATGPQLKNPSLPYGATQIAAYVSIDGGATFHSIAANIPGLGAWLFNTRADLVPTFPLAPITNTALITAVNRGWVGYNGVDLIPPPWNQPQPVPGGNIVYFATPDVATVLENMVDAQQGQIPTLSSTGHPAGPSAAPSASVNLITNTAGYFNGNWLQFKVAFLYRDGTVSFPSPASAAVGTRNMVQGTGVIGWNLNNVPIGLIINDNDVVARFVYWSTGLLQTPNYSVNYLIPMGGLWPIPFLDPTWADSSVGSLVIIPNNTETSLLNFSLASLDATYSTLPGQVGAVVAMQLNKPYNTGTILSVDPIPVWPNPDGLSLEDVDPPDPITNANVDLLHGESGSQPFSVFTDLSQVRNRIYVVGSGSSCLLTAAIGDLQIQVGDISNFSPNGGKIKVEDPATGQYIIIRYNGVAGVPGATFITLALALDRSIPQGSLINNFFQADDTDSQRLLARAELDANGNPTDGIHEYTIVDGSLKALFQLYMRAYAELELFSKPIITIKYATRDPKSRSGQTVHVDMTNPPCKGDFLIQEVTIDQIHDESDVLTPRYTVSASSVKFELNDLLLQILGGKVGGGASSGGIAVTSISTVNTQTNTILIAQYTLSQGQLSALLTTPVEILSAPGAGKIIVILFAFWHTNEPASFSGTTSASLRYGVNAGGGGGPAQNDITAPASITSGGSTESRWTQNVLTSGNFFDRDTPGVGGGTPVNKSIYIRSASNAGTGGAGASCAITITYMVIDAI